MINHVTVKVEDFEKEEAFYEAALTPLGYGKGPAFPGVQAFVAEDGSAVWVSTAAEGDAVAPIHVAFQAADNDAVKAFYEAGLANGGTDNGCHVVRDSCTGIAHLCREQFRQDRADRSVQSSHDYKADAEEQQHADHIVLAFKEKRKDQGKDYEQNGSRHQNFLSADLVGKNRRCHDQNGKFNDCAHQ